MNQAIASIAALFVVSTTLACSSDPNASDEEIYRAFGLSPCDTTPNEICDVYLDCLTTGFDPAYIDAVVACRAAGKRSCAESEREKRATEASRACLALYDSCNQARGASFDDTMCTDMDVLRPEIAKEYATCFKDKTNCSGISNCVEEIAERHDILLCVAQN